MSEVWKMLSQLFSAGKLTEVAASFALFLILALALGYGLIKMVEMLNKTFGAGADRVTKDHIDTLSRTLDDMRREANDGLQNINSKIDTMLMNLNDASSERVAAREDHARLQQLVEGLRDKRAEDVADILVPVKLTLEHIQREMRETHGVSEETQRFVQRLHTDLSTLHGLIIGINSTRTRIK